MEYEISASFFFAQHSPATTLIDAFRARVPHVRFRRFIRTIENLDALSVISYPGCNWEERIEVTINGVKKFRTFRDLSYINMYSYGFFIHLSRDGRREWAIKSEFMQQK